MKLLCITAPLVWLSALAVSAEEAEVPENATAEATYELCLLGQDDGDESLPAIICRHQLNGFIQAMVLNCETRDAGFDPVDQLSSSIPPSTNAARQAFFNFMEDHPDRWGDLWAMVLSDAISETFPCEG